MKKSRKTTLTLLCAALIAASAAGCAQKQAENTANKYPAGEVTYPIKTEGEKVTFWVGLNSAVSKFVTTATDTQYAQEANKRTGINVEFVHPPAGQEETKFNLLLASGSMPDIIAWDWMNLSDDIDDLIDKGYITKLNGAMERYIPNMTKYIKTIDGLDKLLQTDGGNYYVFPFVRDLDEERVYCGPVVRKDWLDELGLEIPETMDEWHTMLTKFKQAKGVSPFLSIKSTFLANGMFLGAYGTTQGMYVDNGKIVYGPATENYKKAIETLAQWYSEGLIDQNYISIDAATMNSKMLNNEVGATYGYNASGIGTWTANGKTSNPKFEVAAAKYPVLEKGQKSAFGQKINIVGEFYDCVISGSSKNKELAARFLDYNFTDEGHMLQHYGTEGKTYTMVDGAPKYTDFVMHNPDGRTISEVLTDYTHTTYSIPGYASLDAYKQQLIYPQQHDALEKWSDTDADKHLLPPLSMPSEEMSEYTKIMSDIKTYVSDTTNELIMGVRPISDFDEFFETLKTLGVERAVELEQAAYDRYLSR